MFNALANVVFQISSLIYHITLIMRLSFFWDQQKLPDSSALPQLTSDDDIAKVLSWCEERVIAINEALVLDSTKPVTTDDSQVRRL